MDLNIFHAESVGQTPLQAQSSVEGTADVIDDRKDDGDDEDEVEGDDDGQVGPYTASAS